MQSDKNVAAMSGHYSAEELGVRISRLRTLERNAGTPSRGPSKKSIGSSRLSEKSNVPTQIEGEDIACDKCGCYYGKRDLGAVCGDFPRGHEQCAGTIALLEPAQAEALNRESHRTRWRR